MVQVYGRRRVPGSEDYHDIGMTFATDFPTIICKPLNSCFVVVTNASGTLTSLPGSPATDSQGSNSAQVWFDSIDKQLICSEQSSNSFGLFHVSSGTYSFLAHFSGTGGTPTAMAQVNHNLIVTNDGSSSISVYKVELGSMTYKTTISLPVSGNPNGIAAF